MKQAKLLLIVDGQTHPITILCDQSLKIGSAPECDICLHEEGIEPQHGTLTWSSGKRLRLRVHSDLPPLLVGGRAVSDEVVELPTQLEVGGQQLRLDIQLPTEDKAMPSLPPVPPQQRAGLPKPPPNVAASHASTDGQPLKGISAVAIWAAFGCLTVIMGGAYGGLHWKRNSAAKAATEAEAKAESERLAKEKADAEEEQKQMTAQAEAARMAKEKADADESARQMAAEAERKRIATLEEEQKQKDTALVAALSAAGKTAPFTNSLDMKFVPAGTPGVLFSVWETRVKDFSAFVEESGHDAISDGTFGAAANTLEKTANGERAEWTQKGGSWQDPHFPSKQSGEHPVVCVSYLDAEVFCAWLTKKDRANGKIPAIASYRLPTDAEWSRACGSGKYPWGENYPPKSSAGNYCGKEAVVGALEGFSYPLQEEGYRDSAARTAAVGMYEENRFGLCDMGGNVQEWCSTWYEASMNEADMLKEFPKDDGGGQTYRVLRGASWNYGAESTLRSSYRNVGGPHGRCDYVGFRCVLVVTGG